MSVDYLVMNNEISESAICMKRNKSNCSNLKEILRMRVSKLMQSLGLWSDELLLEIPVSWERYDNFVIFSNKFFRDSNWFKAGIKLWKVVADLFQVENIALKGKIKNDKFRSPEIRVIFGDSKLVRFKDNGINYSWNIDYCMFCPGNLSERHRIAKLDCTGEVVVDLFAGIGYFTLPFLLKAKCTHLHACEWNPHAIEVLKYNLEANKVHERCTIHEGDNRIVCPSNIADRVNLGLIPTSRDSWKIACLALKSGSGGVLHVHENVNTKQRDQNLDCNDPTHISTVFKCNICMNLIDNLSIKSDMKCPFNLSFNLISLSNSEVDCILKDHSTLSWKRYEWFIWALHTAHCFSTLFHEQYGKPWIVLALNLHYVKSYAPHVDHLVLDLECRPQSLQTTPTSRN